jgi:hypothetical protein
MCRFLRVWAERLLILLCRIQMELGATFGALTTGATMDTARFRIRAMALTFVLLAVPAAGFAQTQTPAREGDIWDWRDHQPTEAQTQQSEQAVGIAATKSQRDSTAAAVDQLYRQLLHREAE